jgi:hypothetical protein
MLGGHQLALRLGMLLLLAMLAKGLGLGVSSQLR